MLERATRVVEPFQLDDRGLGLGERGCRLQPRGLPGRGWPARPSVQQLHAPLARCGSCRLGTSKRFERGGRVSRFIDRGAEEREQRRQPVIPVGKQAYRSLEQSAGRTVVSACMRTAAGCRQPAPGAVRKRARLVVVCSEIDPVAVRLLEVVAEYLVLLDEIEAVLLQPGPRSARGGRRGRLSGGLRRRRRGAGGGGSGSRPRRRAAAGRAG